MMIIVELQGGLGNQLFQYAIGRSLAIKWNVPLYLDHSAFGTCTLRSYALNPFNIQASVFTPDVRIKSLRAKSKTRLGRGIYYIGRWLCPRQFPRHIEDCERGYQASVNECFPPIYLSGYWQNEQYFKEISEQLAKDLKPKLPLSAVSSRLIKSISGVNGVSIHVRRGDYADNNQVNAEFGLCSLRYYQAAMDLIARTNTNIHFFIFSDDIDWCRSNLKFALPTTFIERLPEELDYEHLIAMSECRHHIIANSSFSWWGAWLNRRPEKTVIAPKPWFLNYKSPFFDPVPAKWIRISNDVK